MIQSKENNMAIEKPYVPNKIITPDIKSDEQFQKCLALLARSDAQHDLSILNNSFKDPIKLNAFNRALPVSAQSYYSESESLASIMTGLANTSGSDKEQKMNIELYNVPNKTSETTQPDSIFTIGYNNVTLFNYGVSKFVIECSTNNAYKNPNGDKTPITPSKINVGSTFCKNTALCGSGLDAAIIVDFNQHGFISKLKNGTNDNNYNIHYLMTPEVVNDPAGKISVGDNTIFTNGIGKGVNMFSYVQTDISLTPYTSFNKDDPITSNNFFSKYNFNLSPIKQIYTKQIAEKFITTLDISYTLDNGKPLTNTIEDSKGENNISNLLGYITKLLLNITSNTDNSIIFNFNSKCQQKRGGDWFQALSCLDIENREFTQILPERGTSKKLPEMPVYFVSHDKIAVSYALLNGVNVIYLDYYGNVFVFKNMADKLLKSDNNKDIEELLFNGIKNKWTDLLDALIVNANNYQKLRNIVIKNQLSDEFITKCNDIKSNISSVNNTNYYNIVEKNIKLLFMKAVGLFFVKTNFIDISNEILFIEQNKEILNGEYNSENKAIISKLSKCISILKCIKDKFGTISSGEINNNSIGIINNWLPINLLKLDVYRAANNLFSGSGTDDEKKLRFDIRLLNFGNDNSANKRISDRYIFLPFIQTLENITVVNVDTNTTITGGINNIIEIMNVLIEKTKDYNNYLNQTQSNSFFSRINRRGTLSGEQINFNKVTNFIYEAMILLNNTETTTTVINYNELKQLALISESNDNIIVSEDAYEIGLLRGEGKVSNDTSSNVTVGGGYDYYFSEGSKKESIICDVSIKQITWPLLNSIILNEDSNVIASLINNVKRYLPTFVDDSEDLLTQIHEILQKLNSSISTSTPAKSIKRSRDEYEQPVVQNIVGGGVEVDTEQNILQDFNFGYHPLLPIYMILSSYWYQIGPKMQSNSFYSTYVTYYNMLNKMEQVITSKYLSDPSNLYQLMSGYFIGFSLKFFFFTSNTNANQKLLEVLEITQDDYYMISLKNGMFSNLINGDIILTDAEEQFGLTLIESDLFKNFINDVDIKNILLEGSEVTNIPEYTVLQDNVYNLLSNIVIKINVDRNSSQNNINQSNVNIIMATPIEDEKVTPSDQQSPSKDVAMGVSYKLPSLQRQLPFIARQPNFSSLGLTRAQGGKSKKYKIKKKLTRKPHPKKLKKTQKKAKVHKRTKKH